VLLRVISWIALIREKGTTQTCITHLVLRSRFSEQLRAIHETTLNNTNAGHFNFR
jgi:hypothetical protein